MGKVDELTVGIVTKVMRPIGWVVINDEEHCYNDRVYYRYSMVERVRSQYSKGYRVKPVYIEESAK